MCSSLQIQIIQVGQGTSREKNMSERNMYNYKHTCTPETEGCPFDLEINKFAVDLSNILELNTK